MKNLRITLGVAAIAIGSFAAFSFAPAKVDSNVALQEFYVNPTNNTRGDQVIGKNQCDESTSALCSQEYNTTNGQPTNNASKMHYGVRSN